MEHPKILVFDAPTRLSEPYEQRMQFLKDHIVTSPYLHLVESVQITSKQHLLECVAAMAGEELLFRKPGSQYLDRYSLFTLQVKYGGKSTM